MSEVKFRSTETFGAAQMERTQRRMAHEILEHNRTADAVTLVGVLTRGAHLARRIAGEITAITPLTVQLIDLDPRPFRDDVASREAAEQLLGSDALPVELIRGQSVVIVDDVLFTGRTVRSAMDYIISQGRPAKIQLAVLVDRGHRELPIRPDYVGYNIPTHYTDTVNVNLSELDGVDSVEVLKYER